MQTLRASMQKMPQMMVCMAYDRKACQLRVPRAERQLRPRMGATGSMPVHDSCRPARDRSSRPLAHEPQSSDDSIQQILATNLQVALLHKYKRRVQHAAGHSVDLLGHEAS